MRGLKAPARSTRPPAAFTQRAVSSSISRLSTEQGPATTTTCSPPKTTSRPPGPTAGSVMRVRSGRAARLASL